MTTLKSCQESGGKLVLLNPQKAVQEVLEVTHLATVIEIYDTEESARDAFIVTENGNSSRLSGLVFLRKTFWLSGKKEVFCKACVFADGNRWLPTILPESALSGTLQLENMKDKNRTKRFQFKVGLRGQQVVLFLLVALMPLYCAISLAIKVLGENALKGTLLVKTMCCLHKKNLHASDNAISEKIAKIEAELPNIRPGSC